MRSTFLPWWYVCRILKMRLTFLQANSDEVGPIRRIVIMTKPERSPVVKCRIIVLLVHAIFFPANIHIFLYDPNTSDRLMCGKKNEQIPGRGEASVPTRLHSAPAPTFPTPTSSGNAPAR